MHDPGHPVWSFLRLLVFSIVLSLALYLNASHFDETEIKSLLTMLLTFGGLEGTGLWLRQKKC